MQLRSLPSYFQGEHSPMTSSDSPFPPLKTEHRYRGVYERAGFDVNLGSGSDARSVYLRKSPGHSPTGRYGGLRIASDSTSSVTRNQQGRSASSHSLPLGGPTRLGGEHTRYARENHESGHGNVRGNAQGINHGNAYNNIHGNISKNSSNFSNSSWEMGAHHNEDRKYEPRKPEQNGQMSYGSSSTNHKSAPNTAFPTADPVAVTSASMPSSAVSPSTNSTLMGKNFQSRKLDQRHDQNFDQRNYAQPQQNQPFQQFQPFQPFQPTNPAVLINGSDLQHFRADGDRNIKNLSLNIHGSNFSSASMPQMSNDSLSATDSPTFDDSNYKRHTPETSASSTDDFVRKNSTTSEASVKTTELTNTAPYPLHDGFASADKDLSEVLGDFRKEVEEHKKYDPRARGPRKFKHNEDDSNPGFGYQKFQPGVDDLNNSSQDDSSFRFNSARQSNETTDTSNDDFENFLQTSEKATNFRNSQLSTISSIISKPERSDDEDEEVEAELERQLESLKMGSDASLSSNKYSDESFVTALNLLHDFPQQNVPSIKIDIASQVSDHEGSDSDTEKEGESNNLDADKHESMHEDEESDQIAPLSFQKQGPRHFTDSPSTPVMKYGFEDQIETPETIKPLSPKNHRVEEELKNINFKGANTPRFNTGVLESLETKAERTSLIVNDNDDEILLHNPTPREFDAFPKSVVGMEVPNFRTSTAGPTHPSGEGPCRVCNTEIDPHARGDEKAIYSKSGDMSGQWHRGCFSCAYIGCDVKFNKHVTCYVLLDNVFCHDHYHSLNGTLCQSCNKGIEGECIENELKQKWHVSCLTCTKCHSTILSDYFLIDNQIFCEHDAAGEIHSMQKNGMSTNDRIEKRRTRMLFIDQHNGM